MNPTAGSFEVCERNQRHFATLTCVMPGRSDLMTIYNSILEGHLENAGFNSTIQASGISARVAEATISLHEAVSYRFLPSATKFVYNWNMRELSNIYQGLTLSDGEYFARCVDLVKLWQHECRRVFSDRMISESENARFEETMAEVVKKVFDAKKDFDGGQVRLKRKTQGQVQHILLYAFEW